MVRIGFARSASTPFAAVSYSVIHCACMIGMRLLLWESAASCRPWLGRRTCSASTSQNLDFTLMTYTTVAGPQLRAALQPGVAGPRRQGSAARDRLVEARLRTLEAELQPHFLFNTLHAISSLVHTNPDGADRMISRLSDLLRLTFDRSGAARVSLQEELEFLQKYLEIEQTRFHDRSRCVSTSIPTRSTRRCRA